MPNDQSISLNKYISDSGMCSRREADKLILAGRVSINRMSTRPGNRVFPGDEVRVDGRPLAIKPDPLYLAFHKPVGIVCTADDSEKDNIIRYVNHPQRLFHVGRLDKLSEGLIFLTNDGDIVNKILRAGNEHEKEYLVTVNKTITGKFLKNMRNGVRILNTTTKPCFVEKLTPKMFRIILTQGLNRQIRRMCTHLGYEVVKLKRIRIMHISLDKLPPGEWREFTAQEMQKLHEIIGSSTNEPGRQRQKRRPLKSEKNASRFSRRTKPGKSSRRNSKFRNTKSRRK